MNSLASGTKSCRPSVRQHRDAPNPHWPPVRWNGSPNRRIRAEPGRSLRATLSYLDLGAEFDDPVRRDTEEIGGPRRYAHEPGGLAVYDDLLARFGTAIELPLRKRVAKALFNKAITLGTLDRSEEEMPRLPSLNSCATSPRMNSHDSPPEEEGFELAVPPRRERLWQALPFRA